jgi:hypothetical protein
MTKGIAIPKSPLGNLSWSGDDDQDLSAFLECLREKFKEDGKNTIPAFEAISLVAARRWKAEKTAPDSVSVPWWALEVIASGFCIYRDSASSTEPISIGEAYNLEGAGLGKRPKIADYLREIRDIRIALSIALGEQEDIKIESLLQVQADETKLSAGYVRSIWEANQEHARNVVKKIRRR